MEIQWESEIAALLAELSAVQDELLSVLDDKRRFLRAGDADGMLSLHAREQSIIARLHACQERRGALLTSAATHGLPSDSVRSLAATLPASKTQDLTRQIDASAHRARLLQHQSLTNWVLVQRTLIHLAHLLEIIATGGRRRPTYEKGESGHATGSLVDQAA